MSLGYGGLSLGGTTGPPTVVLQLLLVSLRQLVDELVQQDVIPLDSLDCRMFVYLVTFHNPLAR